MSLATLVASAARTTSSTTAVLLSKALDQAPIDSAVFQLSVSALASNATDTLDVIVQHSIDGSNWDALCHFPQVKGNDAAGQIRMQYVRREVTIESRSLDSIGAAGTVYHGPIGANLRVEHVIANGSGSASFTFAVTMEAVRKLR